MEKIQQLGEKYHKIEKNRVNTLISIGKEERNV